MWLFRSSSCLSYLSLTHPFSNKTVSISEITHCLPVISCLNAMLELAISRHLLQREWLFTLHLFENLLNPPVSTYSYMMWHICALTVRVLNIKWIWLFLCCLCCFFWFVCFFSLKENGVRMRSCVKGHIFIFICWQFCGFLQSRYNSLRPSQITRPLCQISPDRVIPAVFVCITAELLMTSSYCDQFGQERCLFPHQLWNVQ